MIIDHPTVSLRVDLVTRMYQDHGFEIEEIHLRLRYPIDMIEKTIEKYELQRGKKTWRY